MPSTKSEPVCGTCPVGKIFMGLEEALSPDSQVSRYLNQTCLAFLKTLRAIIDERIDSLEKRPKPRRTRKMTKISVD